MRLFALSVLALTLNLSLPAAQADYFECSKGFFKDSYGRGIEEGFRGGNFRPNLFDATCYDLGVRRGKTLRNEPIIFDCEGDFDEGYAEGLKASSLSAGTACYGGGYSAGLAALRVGAREGNLMAGQGCLDEYRRGYHDGSQRQIPQRPIGEPEATCYLEGHYDGEMLN